MVNEDEQKPGQKQPKSKRKFSRQQYDLLKRCSDKKDITEWNKWRSVHRKEKIWLQGVNLSGAHLKNVNLAEANLENIDLREANLEKAMLSNAHLEYANLSDANLKNAHLQNAYLENAYLREAHLKNAFLWGAHLENADLRGAHMENADLMYAHLENAKLEYAHLEKVNFWSAHLENAYTSNAHIENAYLDFAHLENANLRETNLRGAHFWDAKLQCADFSRAIVDGETLFSEYCEVDRNTKFEAVALGNLRIYPRMRQLLEYNIRRMNWEEWYKQHRLLQWPVKLFWSFSDYGISTWRIIGWFFLLALAFAAVYANCACWWPPGIVNNLDVEPHLPLWHYFILVLLRPVYFSIVTMTTLGFGDMHANEESILGHALLTLQVILGYVLLGALVTRFAVLFTAGGPAGKFSPTKTKETRDGKKNEE